MKKKDLDTNPINDLFHSFAMERKQRDQKEEPVVEEIEKDPYLDELRDKKRARYEALKKKARVGWDD
jgi:hypothetical protein